LKTQQSLAGAPVSGHSGFVFEENVLPPMTAVLYYRWLAAGLHDNIISQGVGGDRVYVGIRHPENLNRREITQITFSKSFIFKMFFIHAKMQSPRFQIPPD